MIVVLPSESAYLREVAFDLHFSTMNPYTDPKAPNSYRHHG